MGVLGKDLLDFHQHSAVGLHCRMGFDPIAGSAELHLRIGARPMKIQ